MSFPSLDAGNAGLLKSMGFVARGGELRKSGDVVAAVRAYEQAIRAFPLNGAAYYEFLTLLLQIKDIGNAAKVLDTIPPALYQKSKSLQHLHAILLLEQARFAEAIALLETLKGDTTIDQANLSNDLGSCYNRQDRLDEALAHYLSAFSAGMRNPLLYMNIAGTYHKLANTSLAEKFFQEGLRKFPGHPELTYEYAYFLLKTENYAKGFDLYRSRWQAAAFGTPAPLMPIPEWDRKSPVQSLLVLGEQGVGDQIVFSALLGALIGKADKIAIAFDRRLNALLKRSYPSLEIANEPHAPSADELRARYDAYISVADLGALVPEAAGWTFGYLKPDQARTDRLRAKYQAMFPGKKLVGISWKSSRPQLGEKKSADIAAWQPVLENPACQFISLQYGDIEADLARAADLCPSGIYRDPEIDSFSDLDGLAAQIAALDLVISTSNTTVHAAAAIDAPTWLLSVDTALFWYWGLKPDRVAWYPHLRQFRINKTHNWAPAMQEVAAALQHLCEAGT